MSERNSVRWKIRNNRRAGQRRGAVYRVEDKKIGLEIALKLINLEVVIEKKTIERFRNELKTTRMISHGNVCRIFDLSNAEGTHFITMEYVPGEDLKSLIRRNDRETHPCHHVFQK